MRKTTFLNFFSTEDGQFLCRCKGPIENPVPFGCYYDEGEVNRQLEVKLNEDFYPLIEIIEQSICHTFGNTPTDISWKAWISDYDFCVSEKAEIIEMCRNFVDRYGANNFDLFLNINFRIGTVDVGTQIRTMVDSVHVSDLNGFDEFLIWEFSVAGVKETIDEFFSKKDLTTIIENIIGELERCYKFQIDFHREI